MPPAERASRKRPVSCHFCRVRKLRCSRQFPCTNCTTRGHNCQLDPPQPSPLSSESTIGDNPNDTNSNLDILSRLQRLEAIVLNGSANKISTPETVITDTTEAHEHNPSADYSERLERECMDQELSKSINPDNVIFKTCPIRQITNAASYIHQSPTSPSSSGDLTKCIWLPMYQEATVLLEKYLQDITYVHHVVHLSSVRVILNNLYSKISTQNHIVPGHIALFLAIIASSTSSWTILDLGVIFSTVEEAHNQSTSWIKATLDVLDYARRVSAGSIEDIQAMIILSFVVCNIEGISPRYRNLISGAITIGRELELHRIDHPSNIISKEPPYGSVEAEVGRRVWWYLAATDWMLSRYAGPQEGVYSVNLQHMAVNRPRNINDEDLTSGSANAELPLSEPTSMSYFLQRIRLAELSREITDRLPLQFSAAKATTHGQIMEIDAKFKQFVQQIPTFFCLDGGSLEEIAELNARRAPGIIIQRYILNNLVHAHRCKLHVHYLALGLSDPVYAQSREICLYSARMIIRAERMLEKEDVPFVLTRLKFSGTLYCVVMASIVLLLDVCLNRNAGDEDERKREVADACNILETAKKQSVMAEKLLNSLMGVLKKYQVFLPGLSDGLAIQNLPTVSRQVGELVNRNIGDVVETQIGEASAAEVNYSDTLWSGLDGGMDIDTVDWSKLFAELDSQFI